MDFLNRVFRGDKVVWVVFMLLLLISVVEVFSAASMLTYKSGGNYWWPIRQHSTYLFLGFVVAIIACDGPDKEVYCRTCYGKKWGPHGYGFACGSGFLQTDGLT